MPRIHSIKTTTLYLPPINPKSNAEMNREPVTLEVLMMAQKIARDRGSVFDIEAFMPESLRAEWEAMKRGEEWPKRETLVDAEGSGDQKRANGSSGSGGEVSGDGATHVDGNVGNGLENGNGTDTGNVPSSDIAAAALVSDGTGTDAPSTNTSLDPLASTAIDEKPSTDTPATPVKQPFKLTPNHPALLNMHWKQRQKRLAQLASREAAIEKGQVPEYFPELEALIRLEEEKEREKEKEVEAGQKRKRGMTAADVEGIRASASHWNHLLVEARRMRGPQWDYNTQQFLVDRSSEDYYTHMKPPRSDTEIKQDPLPINGNTHATPSSSQSANRPLPNRHSQSSPPVKPPMMQMPPPGPGQPDQRRMSMSSNQQTPQSNPGYHPSPHQQQQHQQQHHQPMYNNPPPNQYPPHQQQQGGFNPAQFLAMQQQQQASPQNPNQTPNQSPGMMNPALLMQAQQRLQAQARSNGQGQGQGVNMASLMAGHGHGQPSQGQPQGQGQGQAPSWNPNMGLSPAMMQSMGVGMGGGGSAGGPMLGGGAGGGWTGGQ